MAKKIWILTSCSEWSFIKWNFENVIADEAQNTLAQYQVQWLGTRIWRLYRCWHWMVTGRCGIVSYLSSESYQNTFPMWCRCTKPADWCEWRRLTNDSGQPREQWCSWKAVCWWTFISVLHCICSRGKLQQVWNMEQAVSWIPFHLMPLLTCFMLFHVVDFRWLYGFLSETVP